MTNKYWRPYEVRYNKSLTTLDTQADTLSQCWCYQLLPLLVLMKYGEMNPLSNFIPSITSISSWRVLPSLTVMTPSLPTFFMASEIRLPIFSSPLAEIVATWQISSGDVTGLDIPENNEKSHKAKSSQCDIFFVCSFLNQKCSKNSLITSNEGSSTNGCFSFDIPHHSVLVWLVSGQSRCDS